MHNTHKIGPAFYTGITRFKGGGLSAMYPYFAAFCGTDSNRTAPRTSTIPNALDRPMGSWNSSTLNKAATTGSTEARMEARLFSIVSKPRP